MKDEPTEELRRFESLHHRQVWGMSSDASWGAPGGSGVKNQPAHAGDTVSIPGSGRSPGGGNGHPLQASRLENPMDRGAWWATVHELTELVMAEQLRTRATATPPDCV